MNNNVIASMAIVFSILGCLTVVSSLPGVHAQEGVTSDQQTLDAAVARLFTQTAQALHPVNSTQVVETAFAAALTATARFQTPGSHSTPVPSAESLETPIPDQDLALVTRLWFQAIATVDVETAVRYTCRANRDEVTQYTQNMWVLLGLGNVIAEVATKIDTDFEFSLRYDDREVTYTVLEQTASSAIVHVGGEAGLSMAGRYEAMPLDLKYH